MAQLADTKKLKKMVSDEREKIKKRQKKDPKFMPATNKHDGGSGLVPENIWNKLKVKNNG